MFSLLVKLNNKHNAIATTKIATFLSGICLFSVNSSLQAQVTPDGTVQTSVNQNDNIAEITGGETRGTNLFHSFQDFSIPTGNEAFFDNANSIENIFSRVTGGNISNINGIIRANGDASLFLINPAGIVFGEGARLDLGGSFYAATADSILFPDDVEFSATSIQEAPLLTINAPIGLNLSDNPGDIDIKNTSLSLAENQNLTLIGGNINLDNVDITAPGGRVELGGLLAAGKIMLGSNSRLSYPDTTARANVFLTKNAVVDTTSDQLGLIVINTDELRLTDESLLLANIGKGLGEKDSVAGIIEINSREISADGKSLIQADNLGIGQAGTVNITTESLSLEGGSAITATTFGIGDAGKINVIAQDIALDEEFTGIYSNVGLTNIASESEELNVDGIEGNAGIINIETENLSLTNGARIITTSIAQGDGGTINIKATGEVSYIGQGVTPVPAFGGGPVISGSFSQVQQAGEGNSGEVNITADSLTLIDKGAVLVDNSGKEGNAGDITLNIQNNIFLDQVGLILAQVQEDAEGKGGDINITANSFEAKGSSFILADTKGQGDAGNININIDSDFILQEGSQILTEVQNEALGDAGDINISSNYIKITNNGLIASRTLGQGDAGNININTSKLQLTDKGNISVDSQGRGIGGSVFINTRFLDLKNGTLSAISNASRKGIQSGNINLTIAENLTLENKSLISARATGISDGGNININTEFITAFSAQNNDIIASAQQGNGGNINIAAEALFGIEERSLSDRTNDINASSDVGLDGEISIETPDVDPASGLVELQEVPIDVSRLLEQNLCEVGIGVIEGNSSFINIGRGGMPPSPYESLDNDQIFVDVELPKTWQEQPARSSSPQPIVEATAWTVNREGKVELVSQIPQQKEQCHPMLF